MEAARTATAAAAKAEAAEKQGNATKAEELAAEAAEAAEEAALAAARSKNPEVRRAEEKAADAARAAAEAAKAASAGDSSANVTAAEETAAIYVKAAEAASKGHESARLVHVQDVLMRVYKRLMKVNRYSHSHGALGNVRVDAFGWVIFGCSVFGFGVAHFVRAGWWPLCPSSNMAMLSLWAALALANLGLISYHYGSERGALWLDGYLLELVFMLDNIFVLHIVTKPFHLTWEVTYRALVIAVICQVFYAILFYMVLAEQLRKLEWLQYLLGLSLLWAAYQAASGGQEDEFDIMETSTVQFLKAQLGDRLVAQPHAAKSLDAPFVASEGGKVCLTMGGLMLLCLVVADFVLEIDVTLSKIDELKDRYVCLSSSALAAFTLPDIFRLVESLFQRYYGLKYGIAFVLGFMAMQMLLHSVFMVPALAGVVVIVAVMCLSVAVSVLAGWGDGTAVATSPRLPG